MSIWRYPWPSILCAIASGWFVLSHLSQRWIIAGEPTPMLVPILICITICLACIADASISLFRSKSPPAETATIPDPDQQETEPPAEDRTRLAWYFGSLAAFAVLIEPVGFVLSVLLIMPLLLTFGERVPARRSLTITVITGLVVYVVFLRLLGADLPSGWLFDDFW